MHCKCAKKQSICCKKVSAVILTTAIFQKWVCTCSQEQICQVCMVPQDSLMKCSAPAILADMMHLSTSSQQLQFSVIICIHHHKMIMHQKLMVATGSKAK